MSDANSNIAAKGASIPWVIVICGCLVVALSFGPRSAMGFFQIPLLNDTGWDRTTFGFAMALQNLMWGAGQPLFGALADRYGTGRVLVLGGLLSFAGLLIMANPVSPAMLHLGGGILFGLGVGASSFGIVLSAFARNTPAERRSLVFGMGTAAGSAGMFLFAPISQALINEFGWSDALVWLGFMTLAIPVLAITLRGNADSGSQSQDEVKKSLGEVLTQAFGHTSYLLLIAGFFVCGFHVAFISAHFPAYVDDLGLSANIAVISISLIGFFNIFGSLGSGVLGQHYSKPYLLTFIYLARAIAIIALLLLPKSSATIIVFSVAMGFLWLSTVAPTNALVAVMFGTRNLGLLGGIVFFSHQIGSFIGVWLGGYLHDLYGSYDAVWWCGIALSLFAAVVHWPIKEEAAQAPVAAAE